MSVAKWGSKLGCAAFIVLLVAAWAAGSAVPSAPGTSALSAAGHPREPSTLSGWLFVSTPPIGSTGPDDITRLAVPGLDHGRGLIWTAFQNGINPNGTPGTPGGATQSTIAGYDPSTGTLERSIAVTGKVDGLTADPVRHLLVATVNEDDHSALFLVYPGLGAVAQYAYSPDPAVSGNGGTDSIAIRDGQIYVAHSNPNDVTQATEYLVTLHRTTLSATLSPVFYDDSNAVDVVSGASVQLALTDPDTNFVVAPTTPRFADDLGTISQADGKIVFADRLGGTPSLHVLNLNDNLSGNVPPIDGLAIATCGSGTLYVVDGGAGTIQAFHTKGWPAGTVFVGEPKDNGNPLVGTLQLDTGQITPLGNHFNSPKGLLFVGDCGGEGDHDSHHPGDDDPMAGRGDDQEMVRAVALMLSRVA